MHSDPFPLIWSKTINHGGLLGIYIYVGPWDMGLFDTMRIGLKHRKSIQKPSNLRHQLSQQKLSSQHSHWIAHGPQNIRRARETQGQVTTQKNLGSQPLQTWFFWITKNQHKDWDRNQKTSCWSREVTEHNRTTKKKPGFWHTHHASHWIHHRTSVASRVFLDIWWLSKPSRNGENQHVW